MKKEKRNLLLYLFGSNTSIFGDVLLTTGFALHIMRITESPKAFAGILALAFVPRLIFNFFSGAVVDRLDSKKVMITLDAVRGIALLLLLTVKEIDLSVIVPFILGFAVVDTFFIPASITIVPSLFEKEHISKVNSLDQSIRSTLNVVSPMIASLIFASMGIKLIIFLDAVTFLLSAVAESMLSMERTSSNNMKKESLLASLRDGVKVIFSDIRVSSLLVNGALTHLFLFTFIEVGMISLLIITFKSPETDYGILQGVISASAILASVIAVSLRNKKKISEHINTGIIGMILAVMLFIPLGFKPFISALGGFRFAPLIYLSSCCFFMYLSFGYYVVFFRSFYQSEVPKAYLGRFSSIFMILVSIARITGMYIYGILFETQNLLYPVIILGVGMGIKFLVHIPFLKADRQRSIESEVYLNN